MLRSRISRNAKKQVRRCMVYTLSLHYGSKIQVISFPSPACPSLKGFETPLMDDVGWGFGQVSTEDRTCLFIITPPLSLVLLMSAFMIEWRSVVTRFFAYFARKDAPRKRIFDL